MATAVNHFGHADADTVEGGASAHSHHSSPKAWSLPGADIQAHVTACALPGVEERWAMHRLRRTCTELRNSPSAAASNSGGSRPRKSSPTRPRLMPQYMQCSSTDASAPPSPTRGSARRSASRYATLRFGHADVWCTHDEQVQELILLANVALPCTGCTGGCRMLHTREFMDADTLPQSREARPQVPGGRITGRTLGARPRNTARRRRRHSRRRRTRRHPPAARRRRRWPGTA